MPKPTTRSSDKFPHRNASLIVFEGIDGVGKSTQVAMLAAYLDTEQITHLQTRQPTLKGAGKTLRDKAATGERFRPAQELVLVLRDKADHADEVIEPALERGEVVILDRYYLSTMAYQSFCGWFQPDELRDRSEQVCRPADITIILDAPVEIAASRIKRRNEEASAFEAEANLRHCREVFLAQAGRQDTYVLSTANCDPDELHERVLRLLYQTGVLR